jgi:transcriptional regulator GlxA family with amidase domain
MKYRCNTWYRYEIVTLSSIWSAPSEDQLVLTSAGAASGLDVCLHPIRKDHGSEVANQVARMCVFPPWRDGGQAQYIRHPVPETTVNGTTTARQRALEILTSRWPWRTSPSTPI